MRERGVCLNKLNNSSINTAPNVFIFLRQKECNHYVVNI